MISITNPVAWGLTWAIEPPSGRDVEDGARYGEQDPPAVLPVELCERARRVRREEDRRDVCAWQPGVPCFELGRWDPRYGGLRHDDALEEIERVEEEGGVDGMGEGERGHDVVLDPNPRVRC